MKDNTNFKNMNKENISNDDLDKRRNERRKRARIRKQKLRRRFYFICGIVFILLILLMKSCSRKKVEPIKVPEDRGLASWYLMQILREEKGQYDHSSYIPKKPYEFAFMAQDAATGMLKVISKDSSHITQADSYAYPAEEIRDYIRGEKDYTGKDKLVFLTFDDGPNNTITPGILDILKRNQVHGTFFVVGKSVTENHEDVLRKTILNGNSIAIHSFSHDYSTLYPGRTADAQTIVDEAVLTQKRLKKIFGDDFTSHVFRYPGGHMSWAGINASDAALKDRGITWIDWNALTGDAEPLRVRPKDENEQVQYLDTSLNQNKHTEVAVVLMHDASTKPLTLKSLPLVINYFKERDYKFCILK